MREGREHCNREEGRTSRVEGKSGSCFVRKRRLWRGTGIG